MIRSGMATSSVLFVAQMQDLLELEGVARMNKPGTDCGNWRWRMKKGAADKKLAEKLLLYTETFRRTRPTEETE
jgi:4-alpha-glucanotransferase